MKTMKFDTDPDAAIIGGSRLGSLPTIGGSRDRGVWHTNFGMNYGSIFLDQLSGYIVFCILLIPLYRYGTKYNIARKFAKRNGAIIYAKIGVPDPPVPKPLLQVLSLCCGFAVLSFVSILARGTD